jgi:hypothetical protein
MRFKGLLVLVAVALIGSIALPASPASANPVHGLHITGSIDIKDDDVGDDDWCRGMAFDRTVSLDHFGNRVRTAESQKVCDEVWIVTRVTGELMSDDRLCNIWIELDLYENTSRRAEPFDHDGHQAWFGGMDVCLGRGGSWMPFPSARVDNQQEPSSNDHGWLRNLTITHQA